MRCNVHLGCEVGSHTIGGNAGVKIQPSFGYIDANALIYGK